MKCKYFLFLASPSPPSYDALLGLKGMVNRNLDKKTKKNNAGVVGGMLRSLQHYL